MAINFMEVMHKVFLRDGEEWVADSSLCLSSNPPQYNIYRLSDKKHSYMFCHEVHDLPLVKYMSNAALYLFLNPNAKTFQSSSGVEHNITLNVDRGSPVTSVSDIESTKLNISTNPDSSKTLMPHMTVAEALFIQNLRTGGRPHTYRRISEVVAEKYPHLVPKDAVGHQWQGEEMVDTAFGIVEGMEVMEAAKNPNLQHLLDKWYI